MYTLAVIGGIVALASHFVWIWGVWRGTMHLNIATWLLWSIIDIAVLAASLAGGAPAPFLAVGYAVGATLVTAALFFRGAWKWGNIETVCVGIAFVCLGLWYIAGPIVGLISLTLGKYCIAGIPTLVNAYQHPERAQSFNWWIGMFAAATNIFGGGSWTLSQSFFPTVALLFATIAAVLHTRRKS